MGGVFAGPRQLPPLVIMTTLVIMMNPILKEFRKEMLKEYKGGIFEHILVPFWLHSGTFFGSISAQFWLHFGTQN